MSFYRPNDSTPMPHSGAISSVSSSQAALAQITLNDFLKPTKIYKKHIKTEKQAVFLSRFLMIFYGVIAILLAFVASLLGDLLRPTLSIAATFVGPFMGIFVAAVLPTTTLYGALSGGLASFVIAIWFCVGQINYVPRDDGLIEGLDKIYALSYLLLAPIGIVISFVLVNVGSLIDRIVNQREQFKPSYDLVITNKHFKKLNKKLVKNL